MKKGRRERSNVQEADRHLMACWVSSLVCLQPKEEATNNVVSNIGFSFQQKQSEAECGPEERNCTKEGDLDIGSPDKHLREPAMFGSV